MIDKNNLKILSYEELKSFLPTECCLSKLYDKAKDKSKFNVFFVHDGDIETEILDIKDDIGWAAYYKFVENQDVRSFFGPVILGNVHCKALTFNEGLIVGDVYANNMSAMYSERTNSFSEICGSLNVEEVLLLTGKGIWGKKFTLNIDKNASINTLINHHQAAIASKELLIKKTFEFPQIEITDEGKREYAERETDWSQHSLEELTTYFNPNFLDLEEYGNSVSFFFQEPTKFTQRYLRYIND